jgi:hypothetical protein
MEFLNDFKKTMIVIRPKDVRVCRARKERKHRKSESLHRINSIQRARVNEGAVQSQVDDDEVKIDESNFIAEKNCLFAVPDELEQFIEQKTFVSVAERMREENIPEEKFVFEEIELVEEVAMIREGQVLVTVSEEGVFDPNNELDDSKAVDDQEAVDDSEAVDDPKSVDHPKLVDHPITGERRVAKQVRLVEEARMVEETRLALEKAGTLVSGKLGTTQSLQEDTFTFADTTPSRLDARSDILDEKFLIAQKEISKVADAQLSAVPDDSQCLQNLIDVTGQLGSALKKNMNSE